MQSISLTDFSAGELSPKFSGRYDSQFYNKGCMTLENWVPFTQGGITTRPGCKYLSATTGNAKARLVPFWVNKATSFVLMFTENSIQAYTSAGATAGTAVTTTYTLAELFALQFAQVGPVLYIVHPAHAIATLTWTTTVTFTLAALTITYAAFVPAWVAGTAYLVGDVVTNGTGPIKTYVCKTAGTAAGSGGPTTLSNDITDGTVHWQYQSSKPFSQANDYPSAIAYFAGRMWFAGTVSAPQSIWASEPWAYGSFNYGEYLTYTTTRIKDASLWDDPLTPETATVTSHSYVTSAGHAFNFEIASDQLDAIQWMVGSEGLIIGTTSSEWVVPPTVTALAIEANPRSHLGSATNQPITINDAPVFVQGTAAGMSYIRKYAYKSDVAEVQSPNLSYPADHIFASGVVQMDYAQMPQPTLYCVTGGGQIAGLLLDEQYNVAAWYRYKLVSGTFESVAVLPGTGEDIVFATYLQGSIRYFVMFDAVWGTTNAPLDSWANVASAGATETMARFSSLTVAAYDYDNGDAWTAVVPAGGAVSIPFSSQGHHIHIGLPITCTMQTQRVTTANQEGTQQMQKKRIGKVYARVLASYPFKLGYVSTAALLETTVFPSASPYTGDIPCVFNGTWTSDAWVIAIQDTPYKTTLLGLVPEVEA